jgi:hypothetical protein
MQYDRAMHVSIAAMFVPAVAVLTAACAYPLGNRMILLHLEKCGCNLTAMQRVFGMTFMSLAIYLPMAALTWAVVGHPSWSEIELGGGVALSSGVVATVLFFGATEVVRNNRVGLAAVEAMQAGELLFSALLGALLLGEPWPKGVAALGAAVVVGGIISFGVVSGRHAVSIRSSL